MWWREGVSGWWSFGRGCKWDIVEIVVHDLLLVPVSAIPAIPASPEPGTRSCGRLYGFLFFFFFCVLLCFSRLPRVPGNILDQDRSGEEKSGHALDIDADES